MTQLDRALVFAVGFVVQGDPLQGKGPFVGALRAVRLQRGGLAVTGFALVEIAVSQVHLAQPRPVGSGAALGD